MSISKIDREICYHYSTKAEFCEFYLFAQVLQEVGVILKEGAKEAE